MSNVVGGKPGARGGVQSNSAVKPSVVAAISLILVLFVGGLAYHFLGSHQDKVQPRPMTTNESWLTIKARESQGDISKLSAEDQKQLYSIAGPSAPMTLRMNYQAQQQPQ